VFEKLILINSQPFQKSVLLLSFQAIPSKTRCWLQQLSLGSYQNHWKRILSGSRPGRRHNLQSGWLSCSETKWYPSLPSPYTLGFDWLPYLSL